MLCWLGNAAQAAAPALYNNTQQMMAEGVGILMRWIRMVLETSLPKDGAWFQTGSCYRRGQMRLEITARSSPKRSKERFKVFKHVADGAADATIFVLSVAISNQKLLRCRIACTQLLHGGMSTNNCNFQMSRRSSNDGRSNALWCCSNIGTPCPHKHNSILIRCLATGG